MKKVVVASVTTSVTKNKPTKRNKTIPKKTLRNRTLFSLMRTVNRVGPDHHGRITTQ